MPPSLAVLEAALAGSAAPAQPVAPWRMWMLVALCRQRARQTWLRTVAHTSLDGIDDPAGIVPGLPDWTYAFHGDGLELCGPGREVLDVELGPDGTDDRTIDPSSFTRRLLALAPRPRVEARVVAWGGASPALLTALLDDLRDAGLLHHPRSSRLIHLHPWLEAHHPAIADLDLDDDPTWRHWTGLLGGSPGDDPVSDDAFARWARALLTHRERVTAIEGLAAVLPEDDVVALCARLMEGPIDSGTGRCVIVLRELGRAPGPAAMALLERLDPTEHNPYTAVQLAEWLFVNDHRSRARGLIQRFSDQRRSPGFRGNPFDDDYALLALRFLPEEALPFVRRALRSRTPACRKHMAAVLSLLDVGWTRRELLTVAAEQDDPVAVRFVVGCLLHSDDPATVAAARALTPPAPEPVPGRIGYTHEEVAFNDLRATVDRQRERAGAVVALLRVH